MTSSFNTVLGSQRDAPPDISKWNYTNTEPDLVKSVNSEIDETTKAMNDYFKIVIDQENQYHKNKQSKQAALFKLIPNAVQTYVDVRDRREANAIFNDWNVIDKKGEVRDDVSTTRIPNKLPPEGEKLKNESISTGNLIKDQNANSGKISTIHKQLLDDGDTDGGLVALNAEGASTRTRNKISELDDMATIGWPKFKVIASEELRHQMPDGRWLTLNQAKGEGKEYYKIAYRGTVELFVAQALSGGKYSKRLINKFLMQPIFQDFQKDKKAYVTAQVDAQTALMEQERAANLAQSLKFAVKPPAEELIDGEALTNEQKEELVNKKLGTSITDYLSSYHGFHAYSWSAGRAEMFRFMEKAWESNELSDQDIIRIGEAIIKGHDGKSRKLKDYWNKEYGALRKKVRIKQGEQIAQHEQDIDTQQHNWWQEIKGSEKWNEIMGRDSKATVEQKLEYLKQLEQQAWDKGWDKPVQELKRNIARFDDLGPDVEKEYFDFLWDRHEAGYRTDPSVLREFDPTGPYYSKIKAIVDGPSMDTTQVNRAKDFIEGQTVSYTKETDGRPGKESPKFRAIRDQATIAFAEHFRAQKSLGKTDEEAYDSAMREVKKGIWEGLYDQYPAYNPDHTAAQDMLAIKEKIKSDPTHLSSKEPWVGEEVHLQAALQYYQLGEGTIRTGPDPTEYYKNFSTLGNKTWSVSDVMKHRLVSTGLINDDGVVNPARALELKDQIKLLHKPSAARTYNVFSNTEGKDDLLKYTDFTDFVDLSNAARDSMQSKNAYSTPGLDWIQQVNIDPELAASYADIVGDVPFYAKLDNLLPGVAEKLVKDTLMEPVQNQPKIPGSSIYSEETGTGWKRSEQGNWEYYKNFEPSQDDSPFSRDWIWDKYRKAWTPSTYIDPLKEPASKTFKYLEQVPGLLSNAFADIPKKLIQEPLQAIGDRTTGSGVFENGRELTIAELEERQQNSKE